MADYASLKVPELKKLLAEKKLSQTGNKADLIARLQDADKKDCCNWYHKLDMRHPCPNQKKVIYLLRNKKGAFHDKALADWAKMKMALNFTKRVPYLF
ncbi:hypothetical protein ACHAPE_005386 [Trichoderma viride]